MAPASVVAAALLWLALCLASLTFIIRAVVSHVDSKPTVMVGLPDLIKVDLSLCLYNFALSFGIIDTILLCDVALGEAAGFALMHYMRFWCHALVLCMIVGSLVQLALVQLRVTSLLEGFVDDEVMRTVFRAMVAVAGLSIAVATNDPRDSNLYARLTREELRGEADNSALRVQIILFAVALVLNVLLRIAVRVQKNKDGRVLSASSLAPMSSSSSLELFIVTSLFFTACILVFGAAILNDSFGSDRAPLFFLTWLLCFLIPFATLVLSDGRTRRHFMKQSKKLLPCCYPANKVNPAA